jgi:hypothetical protein
MQKQAIGLIFAALAAASAPALAQKSSGEAADAVVVGVKGEQGGAIAAAVEVRAMIAAIDHEKRTVTLEFPDARKRTLTVGKAARNFDQAKVGDLVTIQYAEALALKLEKAPGAQPGKSVSEDMVRSAKGDKPSGAIQRTITVVGTITAIDVKARRVTVRGPEDGELDIKVKDAEKLKGLKAGDLVRTTYSEALVIDVSTPLKASTQGK